MIELDEFSIPNAAKYVCIVWHYQVAHSTMIVRIQDPQTEEIYWVSFLAVQYYDGPMRWQGANFSVEESIETLTLLREKTGFHLDMSDEDLENEFQLFTVNCKDYQVRVLAKKAYISKTSPLNF
jgi:hypothetical protein